MKQYAKRQKEFARLYASGLTAHEAARQAGYPESTVQTNAYRLLSSKRIAALIDRYRGTVKLISYDTARQCANRLSEMVEHEQDEKRVLQITRTLTRLYISQHKKVPSSLSESLEVEASITLSNRYFTTPLSDNSSDRIHFQNAENE
jgi:phage terminase small subunit